MNKQEQVRRFTEQILSKIKSSFENHKRKIEKQNSERSYPGGMMGSEAAQSFYNGISDVTQKLQTFLKLVKSSGKLKKERKDLYERKVRLLIDSMEYVKKNKHLIKIKINQFLVKLPAETHQFVDEAIANLRTFDKESAILCGKSYDMKPSVQQSMTYIAELAYFWANLTNLSSITNDHAQQIYVPVQYDESEFKSIINDVRAFWPSPQIIQKKIKVPEIQIKQIRQKQKENDEIRLAHQMLFGFTRPQLVQEALSIYHKESEKTNPHPTALNALGQIYETGKFVPKDMNKAVKYYKRSAQMNDPEGLYKMGKYLEKGLVKSKEIFEGLYPNRQSEIRGGIQLYQKSAKLGHLDALSDLGYIYQKGVQIQNHNYFIQPHPQHALKYYMKAKKSEFPRALNNLGALLITNPNLTEEAEGGNVLKGIKYLQKAIQFKYPKAFLNLGKCYENGVGVTENVDKARSLYLMGAEINDTQCKLHYVKSCLGFRINDDKTLRKMVDLARQVLLQNPYDPEASYYMGLFYQQGIGVQKNAESSLHYINNAARLDYGPALTKLGNFYFTGTGVKKDLQYAKALYENGASKGDTKALINLGAMMEKGVGVEKDQKKAYELYQKAAEMGNPDALLILTSNQNDRWKHGLGLAKAQELGSLQATKILGQTHFIVPKKEKQAQSYLQNLRTLQNFYVKTNQLKSGALFKGNTKSGIR